MRDIEKYAKDYSEEGFESLQEKYRRRKILEILKEFKPKTILDIGCGMKPLFTEIENLSFQKYVCIEPSTELFNNAKKESEKILNVKCINDFYPSKNLNNEKFDFIICSSLLHEIENQIDFVKAIKENCKKDTFVYFCVPNANSFHRILAARMGLIKDVLQITERNVILQQNNVFDKKLLTGLLEKCGFKIKQSGTFFIKPFTHGQMYKALTEKIIDEKVIEGLYNCSKDFPENGSELYVLAMIK